jgi:hypothetical protein
MIDTMRKRSWFRFRLRMLVVIIAILAIPIAWKCYRLQALNAERARVAGQWFEEDEINGRTLRFSSEHVDVGIPGGGVGQIDFHLDDGSGVSKGIYRLDGDRMEIAQNNASEPRPTDFDKQKVRSVWTATRPAKPN